MTCICSPSLGSVHMALTHALDAIRGLPCRAGGCHMESENTHEQSHEKLKPFAKKLSERTITEQPVTVLLTNFFMLSFLGEYGKTGFDPQ